MNRINSYLIFLKMYLFLWPHFEINSVLLFKKFWWLALAIKYSSVKHRPHLLHPHLTSKGSLIYYGVSDREFKYRFNNHTNSFRHRHHEQDTERSKHIWKLKDKGINFKVKWSVAAYASTYRCGSRRFDLYLTEEYLIARANHKNLLNKRTELFSKCGHKNKYI